MPSNRARPPWRRTARGSWPRTSPPGSTSGSRRCRRDRPARRPRSIPTGAVVFKGTKNPDAAWAFVKYLASPAAQTKIMELKASLPANKEVLAGPFATSFDGAKVLADALAYAHLKPSFKGFNDWTTALQTELDANVFNEPKETARKRSPTSSASSTRSSPPSDRRARPSRPADDRAGPTTTSLRRPASRRGGPLAGEGRWALLFLGPTSSGWRSCRPGRSWRRWRSA